MGGKDPSGPQTSQGSVHRITSPIRLPAQPLSRWVASGSPSPHPPATVPALPPCQPTGVFLLHNPRPERSTPLSGDAPRVDTACPNLGALLSFCSSYPFTLTHTHTKREKSLPLSWGGAAYGGVQQAQKLQAFLPAAPLPHQALQWQQLMCPAATVSCCLCFSLPLKKKIQSN